MTKEQVLNLNLEKAWKLFTSNPKMRCTKMTIQEQLIWFQGFNFACYLLADKKSEAI